MSWYPGIGSLVQRRYRLAEALLATFDSHLSQLQTYGLSVNSHLSFDFSYCGHCMEFFLLLLVRYPCFISSDNSTSFFFYHKLHVLTCYLQLVGVLMDKKETSLLNRHVVLSIAFPSHMLARVRRIALSSYICILVSNGGIPSLPHSSFCRRPTFNWISFSVPSLSFVN